MYHVILINPVLSLDQYWTGHKMCCLHTKVSHQDTHAANRFYSALFPRSHVGNRHTKFYLSSYNVPHFRSV